MTSVREAIGFRNLLAPGSAELCDLLRDLLGGAAPVECVEGVRPIKPPRVYRLELTGAPWRSVVLKRLQPAIAQRAQLAAERWLPALGLDDRCARLLGVAAERGGQWTWHVYQDLGDETLAARPEPERVEATVQLIVELHTRGAHHPVLADARRYVAGLGFEYFAANVRDAIAGLEALTASGIETPQEYAGLPQRLLQRLLGLRADGARRAQVFAAAAGPDTLLHGDVWPINAFVAATSEGPRARLVDWDRAGVGPFSYDLSAFLFRFPPEGRAWVLDCYRRAVARGGGCLAALPELDLLFDTAERARYANRLIWPALALLKERAAWGFPELAEVERWFDALDEPCNQLLENTGR